MRFQQQALAEGRGVGPTGADGQYGPSTQRVLSDVLRHPAPASLWGPGGRCHGTRASAPVGPGPTPISADSGPGSARPLLDQLNAMIADSDSKADPNDAVLGYKAAGTFAVSTLGPAIDVQTSGRSKPLTGAAWQANGPLQMVRSTHPWAIIHAFDQGPKSTVADKMQARNILTTQMRDKYVAALAQFASAGRGFMTGLGTDIPSMHKKPACFDAQSDVQLCAAVAAAIAHETDPMTLMAFGQRLLASGYPQAATALMAKASTISGGYIP